MPTDITVEPTGATIPVDATHALIRGSRLTITVPPESWPLGIRVKLGVEVGRDLRGHCRSIELKGYDDREDAGEGTLLTDLYAEHLRRIPVQRIIAKAIAQATMKLTPVEGEDDTYRVSERDMDFIESRFPSAASRPTRGRPIDRPRLERVAKLHRQAIEDGEPPTKRIALDWRVNRATARRWVARAVEAGLLDKAERLDASGGGKVRHAEPSD